jgi:hypothetical protein
VLPPDSLDAQALLLFQEAQRARRTLESVALLPALRQRVVARFEAELEQIAERARDLRADLARPGQPYAPSWQRLSALQRESRALFAEFLAFLHGALARASGLDGGVCALTDALLVDLEVATDLRWGRITVPDTQEFMRDTAQIIRIRFPEMSLWSVPFAAHEFGHFVGPELKAGGTGEQRRPLQARLDAVDPARGAMVDARDWYYLQEHFADLYATYAMGPAYVAAFICLRANPCGAHHATSTHPSDAERVHGMLWTIEQVSALDPGASTAMRVWADELRTCWRSMLQAAGVDVDLQAPVRAGVTEMMKPLFPMLRNATPERLAFGAVQFARASALAGEFDVRPGTSRGVSNARFLQDVTRRELVAAAWLARLRIDAPTPLRVGEIEDAALDLYRRLTTA